MHQTGCKIRLIINEMIENFDGSQDAAVASLKSLNKGDVVEVRALQRPPLGVKLVIEAICIMKEVKPKKVRRSLSKLHT